MIFNSIDFLIFFLIFFFLYWLVFSRNLKYQNLLILLGSYIFYAWWDWRFLSLLIGSSLLNFLLGIYIQKASNPRKRQLLLYAGLFQGIGGLIYFKYFNFFITSFSDVLRSANINANIHTLNIILPLGISFYTFRMISYLLDIDKRKIKPTHDWVTFFAYVAFFPSLISGPIDRARSLIPQLEKKRVFDNSQATDGMRQILWGLFKKLVVANNCSTFVNIIFSDYQKLSASTLVLGLFLYAFQVYSDFSGYSDMAIGFSRLIGFNITKNFSFPFFSQNIAEFWRKWHISLTSWITEYVFTPLTIAFRNYGNTGLILAIIINFTLVGIWHGANWTFILFGFLNGCYFIPQILRGTQNKKAKLTKGKMFPSFKEAINITGTFILVMITFVLFRADNITQAFRYFRGMLHKSLFTIPPMAHDISLALLFIAVMMIVEWLQKEKEHGMQIENIKQPYLRWTFYCCLILTIFFFPGTEQPFIYFQF